MFIGVLCDDICRLICVEKQQLKANRGKKASAAASASAYVAPTSVPAHAALKAAVAVPVAVPGTVPVTVPVSVVVPAAVAVADSAGVPAPTTRRASVAPKPRKTTSNSSSNNNNTNALPAKRPRGTPWEPSEVVALYAVYGRVDISAQDQWSLVSEGIREVGIDRDADECRQQWFVVSLFACWFVWDVCVLFLLWYCKWLVYK